ncbi:MAG: cytochrome D1 domain-containing protein [Ilumatobacteraceae bacterium]
MEPRRTPRKDGALIPWLRALGGLAAVLALCTPIALALRPDGERASTAPAPTGDATATPASLDASTVPVASTTAAATTTTSMPPAPDDGKRSDERRLEPQQVVRNDDLQPKSIVASGTGLFVAQNMMYRHNVMVFDRNGAIVARIDDTVDLAAFGIADGVVAQGSPVEAAFTPDGRYVYVSNYKMYGTGFNPVASDDCNEGDWDDSFVYKISTSTFEIERVIPTGSVPKFMAISPDGTRLLVSNWCGFDVTIVDLTTDTPITRVKVGRHPRGIAISSDSRTAYLSVMGEARILRLDLRSKSFPGEVGDAGGTPRHLLLSPDDRYLYVSNHRQNVVRKIDLQQNREVGIAGTGTETRSMALAEDGASLYVVNYRDGTVSKVRTSDMEILQTLSTGVHPVGITYDPVTRQVWVANYAGSLSVFVDR